jgi:two-component system LytT family response regulator
MTPSPARVRTLVIDDEPLAREHLRALFADEPEIDVIGEAAGGSAAIDLIRTTNPELVFLDVEMPGCNGFQVLRAVAPVHTPLVVFVTAYDAHAIHAFDVAAVDYLLKPVAEDRFRIAVRRAVDRIRVGAPSNISAQLDALLERVPAAKPARIPIRADGGVTFVNLPDIDWIDARDDRIRLHIGKTTQVIRETMSQIESRLPAEFVRIHRSVIVNVERVREVQPWAKGDYVLILHDGTKLTSGRTYRERVQTLLQ